MIINERIDPKNKDILYTPIFCKPLRVTTRRHLTTNELLLDFNIGAMIPFTLTVPEAIKLIQKIEEKL